MRTASHILQRSVCSVCEMIWTLGNIILLEGGGRLWYDENIVMTDNMWDQSQLTYF